MIVTILYRLEGEPVVDYAMDFTDVAGDAYYAEAVRWAASERALWAATAAGCSARMMP